MTVFSEKPGANFGTMAQDFDHWIMPKGGRGCRGGREKEGIIEAEELLLD